MLDKSPILNEGFERVHRDKVIFFAITLSRSRLPRGVCRVGRSGWWSIDHEEQNLRETLNPNLSGYSERSRLIRVPLPTPEGPETTRGHMKLFIGDIEE